MTAAFALAMVLVLAVAALFVYVRQAADLSETIDNGLRARSDDVAALIRRSGIRPGATEDGRFGVSEEGFVQVLTAGGGLLEGTSGVRAPALTRRDARRASRTPMRSSARCPGWTAPHACSRAPCRSRDARWCWSPGHRSRTGRMRSPIC